MANSYASSSEKKRNKFSSYSLLSRTRNKLYRKPGNTTTYTNDDTTMSSFNVGNLSAPLHATTPNVSINYNNSSYYQKIVSSSKARAQHPSVVANESSVNTSQKPYRVPSSSSRVSADVLPVDSFVDTARFVSPYPVNKPSSFNGDNLLCWMNNLKSKAEATLRSNRSEEQKFYNELASQRIQLQNENSLKEEEFRKLGDFLANMELKTKALSIEQDVPERSMDKKFVEEEEPTPIVDETQDIDEIDIPEAIPENEYQTDAKDEADESDDRHELEESDHYPTNAEDSDLEIIELESGSEEVEPDANSYDAPVASAGHSASPESSFAESDFEQESPEAQEMASEAQGFYEDEAFSDEEQSESEDADEQIEASQEAYNYHPYTNPFSLKSGKSYQDNEHTDSGSEMNEETEGEGNANRIYNENDIETFSIENTEEESAENEIDEMSIAGQASYQASYQVSEALASTNSMERNEEHESDDGSESFENSEPFVDEMDEDDDIAQERMAFQIDPALIATAVQRSLDIENGEMAALSSEDVDFKEKSDSSLGSAGETAVSRSAKADGSSSPSSSPSSSSHASSSSSSSSDVDSEEEGADANESVLDPSLINLLEGSLIKHEEEAKLDVSNSTSNLNLESVLERQFDAKVDRALNSNTETSAVVSNNTDVDDIGNTEVMNISSDSEKSGASDEHSPEPIETKNMEEKSSAVDDLSEMSKSSDDALDIGDEENGISSASVVINEETDLETFKSAASRVDDLINSILESDEIGSMDNVDVSETRIPSQNDSKIVDINKTVIDSIDSDLRDIAETVISDIANSEKGVSTVAEPNIKEEKNEPSDTERKEEEDLQTSFPPEANVGMQNVSGTAPDVPATSTTTTFTHRSYSFTVTDVSEQRNVGAFVQAESIEEPFEASDSEPEKTIEEGNEGLEVVEVSEEMEHYSMLKTIIAVPSTTPSVSTTDFHQYFKSSRTAIDPLAPDGLTQAEQNDVNDIPISEQEGKDGSQRSSFVAETESAINVSEAKEATADSPPDIQPTVSNEGEEIADDALSKKIDVSENAPEVLKYKGNPDSVQSNVSQEENKHSIDAETQSVGIKPRNVDAGNSESVEAKNVNHVAHHPVLQEVEDDENKFLNKSANQSAFFEEKEGSSRESTHAVEMEKAESATIATVSDEDDATVASDPIDNDKKRKREIHEDEDLGVSKKLKQFTSFFGRFFKSQRDSNEVDDVGEITVISGREKKKNFDSSPVNSEEMEANPIDEETAKTEAKSLSADLESDTKNATPREADEGDLIDEDSADIEAKNFSGESDTKNATPREAEEVDVVVEETVDSVAKNSSSELESYAKEVTPKEAKGTDPVNAEISLTADNTDNDMKFAENSKAVEKFPVASEQFSEEILGDKATEGDIDEIATSSEAAEFITRDNRSDIKESKREVQNNVPSSPYLAASVDFKSETPSEPPLEKVDKTLEVATKKTTIPSKTAKKKVVKKPISAFAAINKRRTRSAVTAESSHLDGLAPNQSEGVFFPESISDESSALSSIVGTVDISSRVSRPEDDDSNTNDQKQEFESLSQEKSEASPEVKQPVTTDDNENVSGKLLKRKRGAAPLTEELESSSQQVDAASAVFEEPRSKGMVSKNSKRRKATGEAESADTLNVKLSQPASTSQSDVPVPLPKVRGRKPRASKKSASSEGSAKAAKPSRNTSDPQKHITMRTRSGKYIGANTSTEIAIAEEQEKLEELLISEVASGDIRANTSVSEVAQNYDEEEIKRQLRVLRQKTVIEEEREEEEPPIINSTENRRKRGKADANVSEVAQDDKEEIAKQSTVPVQKTIIEEEKEEKKPTTINSTDNKRKRGRAKKTNSTKAKGKK